MWPALRNVLTFGLGAGGFLHELLLVSPERPFILAASMALMGFPFVLGAEKHLKGRSE